MLPTNTLRRVARRSIVPALGLAIVTVPAAVLASHQFPDVSDSHPFHADIGAIAGAGITAGFSDGTYRPGDPVTRQSMAAFMRRGFGHVALSAGDAPLTASLDVGGRDSSSTPVPVRQVELTVPGASNAFNPQQMVYLDGHVTFHAAMPGDEGCPCEFKVAIRALGVEELPFERAETFLVEYAAYQTIDVQALFAVPPGERTFELTVELVNRSFPVNIGPDSFPISSYSSLSAMTFPFAGR